MAEADSNEVFVHSRMMPKEVVAYAYYSEPLDLIKIELPLSYSLEKDEAAEFGEKLMTLAKRLLKAANPPGANGICAMCGSNVLDGEHMDKTRWPCYRDDTGTNFYEMTLPELERKLRNVRVDFDQATSERFRRDLQRQADALVTRIESLRKKFASEEKS